MGQLFESDHEFFFCFSSENIYSWPFFDILRGLIVVLRSIVYEQVGDSFGLVVTKIFVHRFIFGVNGDIIQDVCSIPAELNDILKSFYFFNNLFSCSFAYDERLYRKFCLFFCHFFRDNLIQTIYLCHLLSFVLNYKIFIFF